MTSVNIKCLQSFKVGSEKKNSSEETFKGKQWPSFKHQLWKVFELLNHSLTVAELEKLH